MADPIASIIKLGSRVETPIQEPKAKRTLVHVRWVHPHEAAGKRDQDLTDKSSQQIGEILDVFRKEQGLRTLFSEGLRPQIVDAFGKVKAQRDQLSEQQKDSFDSDFSRRNPNKPQYLYFIEGSMTPMVTENEGNFFDKNVEALKEQKLISDQEFNNIGSIVADLKSYYPAQLHNSIAQNLPLHLPLMKIAINEHVATLPEDSVTQLRKLAAEVMAGKQSARGTLLRTKTFASLFLEASAPDFDKKCYGEPTKVTMPVRAKIEMEDRENDVLAFMAKAEPGPQVIIFGAAHDWRNNISAWNKTNENQFSLTVISSPAVLAYEEKFKSQILGGKLQEGSVATQAGLDYKMAKGLVEFILKPRN